MAPTAPEPHHSDAPDPRPRSLQVRAKDHASMAVVLAVAAIAWFGWGHQGGEFEGWLEVGMAASALAAIAAALIVRRNSAPPSMATEPAVRKVYWLTVVIEVVLIVVGMAVLAQLGIPQYASAWTLLVVGVHFLPFVRLFDAPVLLGVAAACVLVSVTAVGVALAGVAPAPTVAGAGGGVVLLASAIVIMFAVRRAGGTARDRT